VFLFIGKFSYFEHDLWHDSIFNCVERFLLLKMANDFIRVSKALFYSNEISLSGFIWWPRYRNEDFESDQISHQDQCYLSWFWDLPFIIEGGNWFFAFKIIPVALRNFLIKYFRFQTSTSQNLILIWLAGYLISKWRRLIIHHSLFLSLLHLFYITKYGSSS